MAVTEFENPAAEVSEFEEALSLLEQGLRNCEDSVALIDGLLKGTAQFYGADRAYVIETDCEIGAGLNTFEWCGTGVEPHKNQLQFLTKESFPRWQIFLDENKPIIIPDTSALHDSLPDEYAVYEKCGVRSLLCAPFSKRINRGFVGVNNPTRHEADPSFLFLICYVVVQELNEIKMQKSVYAAERRASRYNDNEVYVNTFGKLEITNNKGTITDDDIGSDQCCALLSFMLLNYKRRYPIDNLYDVIRPYDVKSDSNPYYVVKNVVYRTRRTLSIISLDELIIGRSGSFIINPDLKINIDTERMEEICQTLTESNDPAVLRSNFHAIKELYRGPLLPRESGQQWSIPVAAYYQSLFLRVLKGYAVRKIAANDTVSAQGAIRDGLSYDPMDCDLHFLMAYVLVLSGNNGLSQTYIESNNGNMLPEHVAALKAANSGSKYCETELNELLRL